MQRPREDARLGALLHRVAQVHHEHVVRDVAHHAQVVRDEEVGEAQLGLQIGQQVQHLRLDRHVERRHRLVGHQQARRQHERARDGDALALAAREHVRVAVGVLGAQADAGQHLACFFGALRLAQRGVDGQRVFEHRRDLLARVERAVRVLEHQLHRLAQLAPAFMRRAHGIGADQRQLPGRGLLDQRDHARERRLAAARLAHHRERAPAFEAERDVAHGAQLRRCAEQPAPHGVGALQVARLGDDLRWRCVAHGSTSATAARGGSCAMASARPGSPSGKWQRTSAPCHARSAGRTWQARSVT
ncbi:hypothetical protein D9M68_411040 [compost metagenome]